MLKSLLYSTVCAYFIILIKSVFQSCLWVVLLIKCRPETLCCYISASGFDVLHISIYLMCIFCIGLMSCLQIPGCGLAICFHKSSFIGTQACPFIYVYACNRKPVAKESGKCGLQTSSSSIIQQTMKGWTWPERQLVNNLPQVL